MKAHRREWMRQKAAREVRLVDANIITSLQQATSFFTSTALRRRDRGDRRRARQPAVQLQGEVRGGGSSNRLQGKA